MHAPAAPRATSLDTLLTYPFAAVVALLGPLAGLVPRGMPVWALAVLALSAALLAHHGGLARLRQPLALGRWATGAVLAFLALAAASVAWSPSGRAGMTVVEIGYVALAATLAGACIADLPEEAAGRLGTLFVGGLLVGILVFSIENALDHPLHRWVNHTPAGSEVSVSNVPKRAAALLALLVWPAALVIRRRGHRLLAPALPLGFAALSLLQSSRSAMAGVAFGLVAFVLASRWAEATRRGLAATLVAAFAGVIPLAYLLDRVFELDRTAWLFLSARHRVEIWWRAADRALETPLLGQGIDASRALVPMGETSQFETLTTSLLPLHPHNAFLQVWLELGALGAALALAVTLAVLFGTRRLERADQPYALASFMAALGMVSTAYGIWQAWWMAGLLAAGLMLLLASRVPRREPRSGRNILVIKLGAFGDFFLAQTAFEAIRRRHAGDRLTLLTIPQLAPLARMSGHFDAVWEDPRGRSLSAYFNVRRMIRGGRFDRVYDLQCTGRTDRYYWLLFPGPWPEWSGTAHFASHNDAYPKRRKVPVLERYARQLRPFGIEPAAHPDLSWLEADVSRFGLDGDYALLIPGSSAGRPDKRWPLYPALAQALAARGVRPVVLGTAIEKELATAITTACPAALDLTEGTGIAEIGALARRAWVSVGNDTGPTHLVAAVGGPTVALFSDASNPIHASGRRVLVHHRPSFDAMDVDGVLEAIERARALA